MNVMVLLAMHGDWAIARLPLHALQLIDEVQDGVCALRGRFLRPTGEVELGHHATLLRLRGEEWTLWYNPHYYHIIRIIIVPPPHNNCIFPAAISESYNTYMYEYTNTMV